MMCEMALQEMLIAEPAELRGGGATPLERHLAECERCGAVASAIVAGTASAGHMLGERRSARRRTRRIWAGVAAIPVAAALVVAVGMHDRVAQQPAARTRTAADRPAATQVSVDVSRGQRAVVMKTADPHVTLVWLSTGADQ